MFCNCFKPKNAGPDQRVPVILRAISDKLLYCRPAYSNPSLVTRTSWGLVLPLADQLRSGFDGRFGTDVGVPVTFQLFSYLS